MIGKIESNKLYVREAFEMWYRIPEYQRPYVWESDNVNELLTDIRDAMVQSDYKSEYFLGSLVLQKKRKKGGYRI